MAVATAANDRIKETYLSLNRRLRTAIAEQRGLERDIQILQEQCERTTGHRYVGPSGVDAKCELCGHRLPTPPRETLVT